MTQSGETRTTAASGETRTTTASGETLDALWAALAEATTAAGDRQVLFLAKLALLLAREVGDPARVAAAIAVALRDLE